VILKKINTNVLFRNLDKWNHSRRHSHVFINVEGDVVAYRFQEWSLLNKRRQSHEHISSLKSQRPCLGVELFPFWQPKQCKECEHGIDCPHFHFRKFLYSPLINRSSRHHRRKGIHQHGMETVYKCHGLYAFNTFQHLLFWSP